MSPIYFRKQFRAFYKKKLDRAIATEDVHVQTYATLVLGLLEEKLFKTMEEKFGQHFGNYIQTV